MSIEHYFLYVSIKCGYKSLPGFRRYAYWQILFNHIYVVLLITLLYINMPSSNKWFAKTRQQSCLNIRAHITLNDYNWLLLNSTLLIVIGCRGQAAEALGKSPEEEGMGNSSIHRGVNTSAVSEPCVTPSHIAVCVNCSDDFYNRWGCSKGGQFRRTCSIIFKNSWVVTLIQAEYCW